MRYPIICDNLRKVYPARDGSKSKVAVKGMSLAVGRGECFGMLGPNGAGKTTSLNMVSGGGREGGSEICISCKCPTHSHSPVSPPFTNLLPPTCSCLIALPPSGCGVQHLSRDFHFL